MGLLPFSPELSADSEPRVVGLDSDAADDLMETLSSGTARDVLSELHEEPAPPSELAERVDTSLQNTQYHLERLEAAGAIEVVGTAYSEKGREMSVYGPADSPLVICAGETEHESSLKAAVSRLFAGLLLIGAAAVAVQAAFGDGLFSETTDEPAPEDDFDAADAPEPMEQPEADATAEGPGAIEAFLETLFAGGLEPGVAFFLGGAIVLAAVVALPYLRKRVRSTR